jgi:UDPglucose 6-dehydrogenase
MKIAIIGTGYVGLVTGVVLAELGNEVTCIDVDQKKIAQLKRGQSPIYEPGLEELLKRNLAEKKLIFSPRITPAVAASQFFFIAVNTPPKQDGSVDIGDVLEAARDIGQALKKSRQGNFKVVINKSTVPIGTASQVSQVIADWYPSYKFEVVSNPEFLREGQAIQNTFQPDRIVLGLSKHQSRQLMLKLYQPFDCPKLITDIRTAEMIKYASNCFLATSISFINSLARLCEKVGADVVQVAEGMRLDQRIGRKAFLDAGIGYGGGCLPKDVQALIQIGRCSKSPLPILEQAHQINCLQQQFFVDKIKKALPDPRNKRIAVWGLAFKPKTDDLRGAPSIPIIELLSSLGAKIFAFDPVVEQNAHQMLPQIKVADDPYQPLRQADLLLIFTPWDIFLSIDKIRMKKLMRKPMVIDGRNIFDPREMKRLGFKYLSIGRR